MENYAHIPKVRSCMFQVKVTSKYTLLGRLWRVCKVTWWSHARRLSYGEGNSLRCEIRNSWRTWVLGPLWSKWHWNIHYRVTSEVYANFHDDRLSTNGDICRGIPPRLKSKTTLQAQFLHVSGQSNIEIYIIGSPLKGMPIPMMMARPWTELQARQFPQGRN
jgi:hypothetical protein